ncbi:hypothetical protein NIES4101_51780 [Calothrix sp. NIES-4101]|nr:hypothetical protein NIES4101_51780 [Calothrix sp. NIES-4101]
MKVPKTLQIFIPICLATIGIVVFFSLRSLDNHQRAKVCEPDKLLTQKEVKNYDQNGIKLRGGTFFRKVILKNKKELKIIIFLEALSPQKWSKVPQSSIQYIGKGGDGNWQEWLRPDFFYALDVPTAATGLAFGRLCYRNGDAEVESIKNINQISPGKITINNKIDLSHSSPLPKIHPYTVIVNTGSNYRDSLGTETEVYFSTDTLSSLPEK